MEDTGTTFITISWTSTSVGSVSYTVTTYSTDNVMISSNDTDDNSYTINELNSSTLYRINVVPYVGVLQGEGKEVTVNTNDTSTTFGEQMCSNLTYKHVKPKLTLQKAQYYPSYLPRRCS